MIELLNGLSYEELLMLRGVAFSSGEIHQSLSGNNGLSKFEERIYDSLGRCNLVSAREFREHAKVAKSLVEIWFS